jgi:hypothetical protein
MIVVKSGLEVGMMSIHLAISDDSFGGKPFGKSIFGVIFPYFSCLKNSVLSDAVVGSKITLVHN